MRGKNGVDIFPIEKFTETRYPIKYPLLLSELLQTSIMANGLFSDFCVERVAKPFGR